MDNVKVTQADIFRALDRAIDRIMSVETEIMGGDNLAIVICSHLERNSEGELGENGWQDEVTNAYEEIKRKIADLFVPVRVGILAMPSHFRAAMLEGIKIGMEAAAERIRVSPLYSSEDDTKRASFMTARDIVRGLALDPEAILAKWERGE